ncbi:MAG: NIPSNAP family protein [Chloroflexi bacterium]|nr:NIPSNAP family protein [Chloroflexota bacterium]
MAVEVHVEGRVALGRMPEFMEAVQRYSAHAIAHGYAAPRILQGLSGEMNSVRLVYAYEDLAAYERDEARVATDREYGRVAMEMPLVEGTITYRLFRVV